MKEQSMRVQISVVHEGRTYHGEVELQLGSAQSLDSKISKVQSRNATEVATRPSDAIELLYRRGFFKEARRLPDVSNELGREGYNFSRQSVFMALKAATFLLVIGKRGAYGFVQKFPASL
jgi:hypothetical protein